MSYKYLKILHNYKLAVYTFGSSKGFKKFNSDNLMKTSYPKDKINILLLEGVHPSVIKIFKDSGYTNLSYLKSSLPEAELIKQIKNVHLVGIRSKSQITTTVIEKAEKLIAIGAFCIGTNQININSASDNGIAVFNSPFSNTRSVAELVIAEIICLMRRIPERSNAAHRGYWLKDAASSFEIRGKKLGIVGYGHIGSQVSVLAESLGMKVYYYDVESKLPLGNTIACKNLDELLMLSDVVSLHVPSTPQTKLMIKAKQLEKMKKGAVLLNLSRGNVVEIEALKKALNSGHILGAGVDVFPKEPGSNTEKFISELQDVKNVILTPHIGGSTVEAQENIGRDTATKLINYLETGSSAGSLSIPVLSLPIQENAHRLLHIHKNVPGVLSEINTVLSNLKVNILGQYLKTNESIGYVVLDIDKVSSKKVLASLKKVKHTIKVRSLY